MRHLVRLGVLVAGASVMGLACAGPHSTGALWAQQNLEQEREVFKLSDAQRAGISQAFELGLADESLQSEQRRITSELQSCPGPRQPLGVSAGDSVRDTIRVRAETDPTRLAQVAHLALADWFTRRASATGDSQFCARAAAALSGANGDHVTPDLLDDLPSATVSRDQREPPPPLSADPPLAILSDYVLGSVDAVTAAAPLPQYLALVYGGFVTSPAVQNAEMAATLVDRQAPAYPDWEPDALYAALRGGQA